MAPSQTSAENDPDAVAIALHLATGEIPDDEALRTSCTIVALILASLKSYGRVYEPCIYDPRSSLNLEIHRVHTTWTVAASRTLAGHLLMCSAAYEAVMDADPGSKLTVSIPAFKQLKLVLRAPEPKPDGPGTPVSSPRAAAAAPPAPPAPNPQKPPTPPKKKKNLPRTEPASPSSPDAPTSFATQATLRFRCLTCTAVYKSPVNAARCGATHPPAGSRLTRRAYDAAAVAGFWDALPYGARLDILEPILPLVSTKIVNAPGGELLQIMDDQSCEKLALYMVHCKPYVIPDDAMDAGDCMAATCYRIMDVIIKAMDAEAAAKERALLEELEAEASGEADRKSRRDAKQKTKREAREAVRRQKTLSRLANDDAFFRSFIPECTHWYLDE